MTMWTSKLGGRYAKDLVERLDSEHHGVLRKLRKLPHNARCAECGDGDTAWASVSIGVFLCVRCSDVHRAVGTHISKVKGCSGTYLWGPDEIARMQELGNAKAEALYGGGCAAAQPSACATKEERIRLCRKKYEQRLWAPSAHSEPTAQAVRGEAPSSKDVPARPRAVRVAPTPARAPVTRDFQRVPVAKPVDDLDLDSFFETWNFGDAAAAADGRPQQPEDVSHQVAALTPIVVTGSQNLDSFLDQCLGSSKPIPTSTANKSASILMPAAGTMSRPASASLWDEDFANW